MTFLDDANRHLDDGIKSFIADRALNPELSEADFVHRFGNELKLAVSLGVVKPDEVALSLVVALNRLAGLEAEAAEGWNRTTALTISALADKDGTKVFEVLSPVFDENHRAWTTAQFSPFMAYKLAQIPAEEGRRGFELTIRGEFVPDDTGAFMSNTVLPAGPVV